MEISNIRRKFAAAVRSAGLPNEKIGGIKICGSVSKEAAVRVKEAVSEYSKSIKQQLINAETPKAEIETLYIAMDNALEQIDFCDLLKKIKGKDVELKELAMIFAKSADGVLANQDTMNANKAEGKDLHNRNLLQAKYLAQSAGKPMKKEEKDKIAESYAKYVIQAIIADRSNYNLLSPLKNRSYFDWDSFNFITYDKWSTRFKAFQKMLPPTKQEFNEQMKGFLKELQFLIKHMDAQLLIIQITGKIPEEY